MAAPSPFPEAASLVSLAQRTLPSDGQLRAHSSCCPTMDLVAVVSPPSTVSLWRMTGQASSSTPVWVVEGVKGGIKSLAWSPDGQVLAITSEDQVILQSVHPPASSSATTLPSLSFPLLTVEHVQWLSLTLSPLPSQHQTTYARSLQPLRDHTALPTQTPGQAANPLMAPVANVIPAAKHNSSFSLDHLAPNFPSLPRGSESSLLCVVTGSKEMRQLNLFLGGGALLHPPITLPHDAEVEAIYLREEKSDTFSLVVTYNIDEQLNVCYIDFAMDVKQRHLAQAATLAQSLLSSTLSALYDSQRAWQEARDEAKAWLGRTEQAQPELTFLYLLATGRAPQDSLRDYLSAKATERSYGKWEMAAMGAHTRLAVTAYQLAAPAVERIAVLFSRLIEGTAVHEAYEQAYRASLALEEAAKDERMAFSEVAKWLRYEIDRAMRAEEPPPAPANTNNPPPPAPPPIPAAHDPVIVARWLKASRDDADELRNPIEGLLEAIKALAQTVSEACLNGMTKDRAPIELVDEKEVEMSAGTMARSAKVGEDEMHYAVVVHNQVHLRHEGHEDDEWEGYFSLETASRESIELLDLGFFDGEEMALLLRYQKTGRSYLATVRLADIDKTGVAPPVPVSRCQPLNFPPQCTPSLALNGRAGRRLGCAVGGRLLEVFDMETTEEGEEGDGIEED